MTHAHLADAEGVLDLVQRVNYPYFFGAIFPSEMAFFLYLCERSGIHTIIESGRENGYSTAVAATYGEQRGVRVLSIDAEWNQSLSRSAESRLRRYPDLELVTGDSFVQLPRILPTVKPPIALLVDGPKAHEAVYLSAAAGAWGRVRLIAHHNTPVGSSWHNHFLTRFGDARRLEDSALFHRPEFAEFRRWERGVTEGAFRDLDDSSLVACVLPQEGPNFGLLRGPGIRHTAAASAVYLWWMMGHPRIPGFRMNLNRAFRAKEIWRTRRYIAARKMREILRSAAGLRGKA